MARKLPLVEGFFFVDVVMLQTATILVVLSMTDMDCLVRKHLKLRSLKFGANSNLSCSIFGISHTVILRLMFKGPCFMQYILTGIS